MSLKEVRTIRHPDVLESMDPIATDKGVRPLPSGLDGRSSRTGRRDCCGVYILPVRFLIYFIVNTFRCLATEVANTCAPSDHPTTNVGGVAPTKWSSVGFELFFASRTVLLAGYFSVCPFRARAPMTRAFPLHTEGHRDPFSFRVYSPYLRSLITVVRVSPEYL
jgi:hypothetical protein